MTVEERDKLIAGMTDYQKVVVLKRVHDALFLTREGTLDPDKTWDSDTANEVSAAFTGTPVGMYFTLAPGPAPGQEPPSESD